MHSVKVLLEYDFEEEVYLKTDAEDKMRMVTGIKIYKNSEPVYILSCGPMYSEHYACEITREKVIK